MEDYLDDSGMGPTRVYRVWYALPRDINHLVFFLLRYVYLQCLGTASLESKGKKHEKTNPPQCQRPSPQKHSRPYLRDHDKATVIP